MSRDVGKWVNKMHELMKLERQEDIDRSLQVLSQEDDGETDGKKTMTKLRIEKTWTGLYGRYMVDLRHMRCDLLPSNRIGTGDVVQLGQVGQLMENAAQGIVTKVTEQRICVSFDDTDQIEKLQEPLRLDRLANDASYRKISLGLDQLAKYESQDTLGHNIINVVFSGGEPTFNAVRPFQAFNSGLNRSQLEAIEFALAAKDIALIHGPPGTGKTTTTVELILQAVAQYDMKILVCAPSNVAVDNVLAKLADSLDLLPPDKKNLKMIRIGHPARLLPQVLKYCLDARIQSADGTEIVQDVKKELESVRRNLVKTKDKSVRRKLRGEQKVLRKEIRTREDKVIDTVIQQSQVVLATNVGASSHVLRGVEFDMVIIDEAAQALEATCWIPILKGKKCVLAGDHCQLPPTILSDEAKKKGLAYTLFDRILSHHGETAVRMLDTQYRMHRDISDWSSKAMYNGKLQSAECVAERKIRDLPHAKTADDMTNATLLLLDTAGCDLEEDQDIKKSKSNAGEAKVVAQHVQELVKIGLDPREIAVITPYNGQVDLLRTMLLNEYPTLEVRSVDGFQGCEKEAVVMSLVRSNPSHQVGFLADDRRINVAITRAKRHCALICDTDTVCKHPFIKTLIEHFEQVGEYRSAQEYLVDEVATIVSFADHQQFIPPAPTPSAEKPIKSEKQRTTKLVKQKKPELKTINDVKVVEEAIPCSVQVEEDQQETSIEEEVEEEEKVQPKFQALIDSSSSEEEEEEEEEKEGVDTAKELLKSLHMERQARAKKKIRNEKKAERPGFLLDSTMSEDDVLSQAVVSSNKCAFGKSCAANVKLMGSVCKFCHLKFCFHHGMPEIHGCGRDVRKDARDSSSKTGTKKSLGANQRKAAVKMLRDKISQDKSGRKKKSTGGSKKKK